MFDSMCMAIVYLCILCLVLYLQTPAQETQMLGAKDRTPEIDTSEIIVDVQ